MSKLLCAVALCLSMSCATVGRYVNDPKTAMALSDDFVEVFAAMTMACETKTLEEVQCAEFDVFAEKFQTAYIAAGTTYAAAIVAKDDKLKESCLDMLSALIPELTRYSEMVGVPLKAFYK